MKQVDIDKWIELGILRERQRIEKLLPEIIALGNIAEWLDIEEEMPYILVEAIALIKGETE